MEDSFDMQQPRGKQRWMDEEYLCWYIPTTGIWKTVWSEYVPKISLSSVKMTPNLEDYALEVEYNVDAPESRLNGELFVECVISYDGKLINKTFTAVTSSHVCTKLNVAAQNTICYEKLVWFWTPENPRLYDVEF